MPRSDKQKNAAFARAVLRWFARERRDLPFRGTQDPYRVWLSETMLQQTQVATMLPYFERFVARFPTVRELADANVDEVLSLWAGLGYYRRARNLHAAARRIVSLYGGEFPRERDEVLKLPGVGAYTAGAVLSIAFGQREPVVDGNVSRVLCRVFELGGDPKRSETRRGLWELARELIPEERPGDFNQGLMEVGALLCTPASPSCRLCPVSGYCGALRNGSVEKYPAPGPKGTAERVEAAAAVIVRRGKVLVAQRPADEVLGGMWEFPCVERKGAMRARSLLRRSLRRSTGLDVEIGESLVTVRHSIMDRRITVEAFLCSARAGRARPLRYEAVRWVAPADLPGLPLPSAPRQIADALRARGAAGVRAGRTQPQPWKGKHET